MLPLTLIASVFGMNVRVPGEGDITAFWLVIAGMLVVLVTMLAVFRRRGWL
jgi:magnesium transporter